MPSPLQSLISPDAQILPDPRSKWQWVRPSDVSSRVMEGVLTGLLGSGLNPFVGGVAGLAGGLQGVEEGMYGPVEREGLVESGVGPKGTYPPLKFPYLFHGTSSGGAKSIRSKGLVPARGKVYLTTSPEIAMAEAVSSVTGIHPIKSGAISMDDLVGMPLTEIYRRTVRYAKKHPDRPGVAQMDKPARGGKPVVLKVRRGDVKGLEQDPEYSAQYVDDSWSEYVGDWPSRARSFFLRSAVPASSVTGAVPVRKPLPQEYNPLYVPPIIGRMLE